ncbi:MAG TPA: hypothetical protein VMT63_09340 [Bacteroidales bacterium]|nr:hypothetical protein [Bacteroidales bacterium]
MKINKIYLSLAVVFVATTGLWVSSCIHDLGLPPGVPAICFDNEVLPIFQNNCAISGCHGSGGRSRFNLTTYTGIMEGITPGNPSQSRFYQAITGNGAGLMPPDNPISMENRTIIRLWILQGAVHTTCSTNPPDTTAQGGGATRACYTRDILPILVSNCAMSGCHDAATHRSGYNFADYAHTVLAVYPGNASASSLYQAITGSGGGKGENEDIMPPPPKSPLTTAQIDTIAAWINYGALNETCAQACDTVNTVTFSGVIWPFMQQTCTGCHSGASPSGGVSLNSYADVQTIAASGVLWSALTGTNGKFLMPPSGSLTRCRLRQFQLWINAGYLNN